MKPDKCRISFRPTFDKKFLWSAFLGVFMWSSEQVEHFLHTATNVCHLKDVGIHHWPGSTMNLQQTPLALCKCDHLLFFVAFHPDVSLSTSYCVYVCLQDRFGWLEASLCVVMLKYSISSLVFLWQAPSHNDTWVAPQAASPLHFWIHPCTMVMTDPARQIAPQTLPAKRAPSKWP